MNLKAALLLFLVFFASATTTIVTVFDAPPHVSTTTENVGYKIESNNVQPLGDPVDSEFAPD